MKEPQNDLTSLKSLLIRLRDDSLFTRQQLSDILICLQEAFPKTQLGWPERAYRRVQSFAKYVGAPALILAAIIPTYNLIKAIRDYDDERSVRYAYATYISELLDHGEVERAHSLLTRWEAAKTYSPALQYLRAKIFALRAIALGKASEEAEDNIHILLRYHQRKEILFLPNGNPKEIFELDTALIDIDTAFQRYDNAKARLQTLRQSKELASVAAATAQIELRLGRIDVLKYNYIDAEAHLVAALQEFTAKGDDAGMAETHFELGKTFQFKTDSQKALDHYTAAKSIMEKRRDELNLLKVYNNLAMMYFYDADYDHASYYYRLEEQASRRLSDDKGLARALVNLSWIADARGAVAEAVSLSTEASDIFRAQGDRLGLATTLHSLANFYQKQGDSAKALYNDKQALLLFQDVKDLRGIAGTSAGLGEQADASGDYDNATFYLLTAISINRYTGFYQTAIGKRNTEAHIARLRSQLRTVGHELFWRRVETARQRFNEISSALGSKQIEFRIPDELQRK